MRAYILQENVEEPHFLIYTVENPEILVCLSKEGVRAFDLRVDDDSRRVKIDPKNRTLTIETCVFETQGSIEDVTLFPCFEFIPGYITAKMLASNE